MQLNKMIVPMFIFLINQSIFAAPGTVVEVISALSKGRSERNTLIQNISKKMHNGEVWELSNNPLYARLYKAGLMDHRNKGLVLATRGGGRNPEVIANVRYESDLLATAEAKVMNEDSITLISKSWKSEKIKVEYPEDSLVFSVHTLDPREHSRIGAEILEKLKSMGISPNIKIESEFIDGKSYIRTINTSPNIIKIFGKTSLHAYSNKAYSGLYEVGFSIEKLSEKRLGWIMNEVKKIVSNSSNPETLF